MLLSLLLCYFSLHIFRFFLFTFSVFRHLLCCTYLYFRFLVHFSACRFAKSLFSIYQVSSHSYFLLSFILLYRSSCLLCDVAMRFASRYVPLDYAIMHDVFLLRCSTLAARYWWTDLSRRWLFASAILFIHIYIYTWANICMWVCVWHI